MKLKRIVSILIFGLISLSLNACQGQSDSTSSGGPSLVGTSDTSSPNVAVIGSQPTSDLPAPNAPQTDNLPVADIRHYTTDALLFVGSGTWSAEVSGLKNIMNSHGMTYRAVTESELNAMSLEDLTLYGMVIFPGGSGGTEAGSLTSATKARLRQAVQEKGMSYIGWCAGAFISAAPAPAPGKDVSYGIGILNAPVMDYYYLENQGVSVAMTMYTFADGSKRDIIWYGGPVTPEIPGGVVARYPNGDPSITQTFSGNGFMMVSAGHPTVDESTKSSLGLSDSDGSDQDIAWKMLEATLNRQPLPAF